MALTFREFRRDSPGGALPLPSRVMKVRCTPQGVAHTGSVIRASSAGQRSGPRGQAGWILNAEVGSPAEYDPRPDWPGGSSGVTIGVGYDLGYTGPAAVGTDWGPHLPAAAVKRLQQVAGIKGDPAHAAADALHDLSVPWDAAKAVFDACDVPRTVAETLSAFPGSSSLPDDSFGALVSLVFNRGALISSTDPAVALRRIEMAQIRDALAQKRAADVPAYLRAMTRLWPPGAGEDGLRTRRNAEAQLFEQGLASAATA